MNAVLSTDGLYRYALWRDTGALGGEGTVLFVMLNPSTADAETDDPTIVRCVRFARDWGFARLAVGNLYAYRATKPADLTRVDDPVGPDNDGWICQLANEADDAIVAAWGASPYATPERRREVEFMLDHGSPLMCLRHTAAGHPEHPLYVPADVEPVPFAELAPPTGEAE